MRARHTLLLAWALIATTPAAQGAVPWSSNLDEALLRARGSNRLVLLHFWDEGCPPCRAMERDVFQRSDVAEKLTACYVPVKLKFRDHPAIAHQLGVQRIPADLVLNAEGTVVHSSAGLKSAEQYTNDLVMIAAHCGIQPNTAIADGRRTVPTSPVAYGTQNAGPDPTARVTAESPPPHSQAVSQPLASAPSPLASYAPPGRAPYAPPGFPLPAHSSGSTEIQRTEPEFARQSQPPGTPHHGMPGHLAGGVGGYTPASDAGRVAGSNPAEPFRPGTNMPNTPTLPPGNPPLALDGYCPVWLTEYEQWKQGDPRWGARHAGRTYLFSGPDAQRRFFENPEFYAPVASGNDVVLLVDRNQVMAGYRQFGVWCGDRIYLFSSFETSQAFKSNPERYVTRWAERERAAATTRETGTASTRPEAAADQYPRW